MVMRHTLPCALLALALYRFTAAAQGSDDCAMAVPASLDVGPSINRAGHNGSATATDDLAAGSPFTGPPVIWYAFTTSQCATVTVSFCWPDPAWGTVFGFLATDCPADSLVYITTFNNTTRGDGHNTYLYDALASGTYTVPLELVTGINLVGPYTVQLTVGDPGCHRA